MWLMAAGLTRDFSFWPLTFVGKDVLSHRVRGPREPEGGSVRPTRKQALLIPGDGECPEHRPLERRSCWKYKQATRGVTPCVGDGSMT